MYSARVEKAKRRKVLEFAARHVPSRHSPSHVAPVPLFALYTHKPLARIVICMCASDDTFKEMSVVIVQRERKKEKKRRSHCYVRSLLFIRSCMFCVRW